MARMNEEMRDSEGVFGAAGEYDSERLSRTQCDSLHDDL